MDLLKILSIGLIAGILAVSVKKYNPEIAMQVSIAAGVLIILLIAEQLVTAVDFIEDFVSQYELYYQGFNIVLKVIGISYLIEFCVQILKDAGENATSQKVEMAGKLVIVVLTIPLLKEFAQVITDII